LQSTFGWRSIGLSTGANDMKSSFVKFTPAVLAVALGLLVSSLAAANTTEERAAIAGQASPATTTDPVKQIPHTLKALEDAKAGKYGELRTDHKLALDKADRDIQRLMQGHQDLNELSAQEKVELFNAQETVLGIVDKVKLTKLVCTYTAQAGTRFKKKHCMSREMAEATKRGARDAVHDMQNRNCFIGEGNSCSTGYQQFDRQADAQPQPSLRGP
jgi:Skp family chaperone for outer membrane proteins